LHQTLKTTMIYVTHDQVEAMTMADKIVVLQAVHIEQVGSPLDLYHKPANVFVAGFIGSPRMNLIEGPDAGKLGAKTIGVRPEHIDISMEHGQWQGVVSVTEHLGSDTFLHVNVAGIGAMTVRGGGDIAARHGDTIHLTPQAGRIHRFGPDGKAL
ncbi:MAG: ABC transporter ATP-binding protein, partial [Paracoccaceae bacterium]|nr:ABC transporter ATP-binding protein [Paracoccaceae bacterium]